ncbi:CvpA family protein [Helicobacter marmotae]|uniref:CvpA family protein n=1 Tax=Helicobacter marmotae TaxID=152490 RepID=A0A3D8I2V1_9HELI|nr:CvpA family protein [Helicobacter marmotae]RDU59054.1 CvpA family protein [Helicobacter marmotae]
MDSLSYIDIGILALLVLLAIKGIWQGIIRGLSSLLGIALGIFFASRYYMNVGEWFAHNIYNLNSAEINALVGFLILIILIWSAFLLVGECLFRMLKFTPLGVLDGALGLVFGFAKAFLLISLIVFGITKIGWLKDFSQNIERNSSIFPVMKKLAIHIMNLEQVQEVKDNLNNMELHNSIKNIQQNMQEEPKETNEDSQTL